jgi:protein phosphatase
MGTTVTAAFADEEGLRLAHVGDSRAYLFREGELRLLTEDHTLVHRMVEEGKISAEEAGTHPQRSILTRALGVEDPVDVDEMTVEAQEGDRFVLCSDGLYSMVRDETIREILQTESDPQRAAEKLVDLANHAGGMDNITVIVLDFEAGEGVEGEPGRTEAAEAGGLPDGEGDRPPSPGVQRSEGRASASGFLGRIPTRLAITVAVVVVVLVGALIAFRAYLDSQWYVGADSGHVAVFQGIPAELVGIRLSHLVHDTPLPAGKVAALPLWQGRLDDGITAESREKAEQIVASMAKALQASKKANR